MPVNKTLKHITRNFSRSEETTYVCPYREYFIGIAFHEKQDGTKLFCYKWLLASDGNYLKN